MLRHWGQQSSLSLIACDFVPSLCLSFPGYKPSPTAQGVEIGGDGPEPNTELACDAHNLWGSESSPATLLLGRVGESVAAPSSFGGQ